MNRRSFLQSVVAALAALLLPVKAKAAPPERCFIVASKGRFSQPAGYFYAPYMPVVRPPVVLEPDAFCPRKGIMTRYGRKMLREGSKYYTRISISELA